MAGRCNSNRHPDDGQRLAHLVAPLGDRVIAWSRRSHFGSDPVDKANPGSYATDLDDFANALGLGQFHIVASAAGCTISLDYAMAFPTRVREVIISAASLGNISEPEFIKALIELEHKALTGNRQGPKLLSAFNWTTLGRRVARHLPNREMVVVPEAGHSIYREQPYTFNRTVLEFLGKA